MSLLIDDDFITLQDLLAIDPEIAEIADSEEITVEGDGGITRQNWDECADNLLDAMQSFGGDIIAWPGTLTTYGAFGISRPRLRPHQIVVTAPYGRRTSPLKRWMTYSALVLFYRAASNRRTSDRYEKKWENFKDEVKAHWRTLWSTGLPMVALPLPCPGALHEYMAGDWGSGNVTFAPPTFGAGEPTDQSYDVAITWVDQSQYINSSNIQNAESGPSKIVNVTVPAQQVMTVDIETLTPPGSVVIPRGIADGPYVSRTATGWNVYVGQPGGPLCLQNATPLPLSTVTYTLAGVPALNGFVMRPGQLPDANYTFQRTLQRA